MLAVGFLFPLNTDKQRKMKQQQQPNTKQQQQQLGAALQVQKCQSP